jgi:hypothetical protein
MQKSMAWINCFETGLGFVLELIKVEFKNVELSVNQSVVNIRKKRASKGDGSLCKTKDRRRRNGISMERGETKKKNAATNEKKHEPRDEGLT